MPSAELLNQIHASVAAAMEDIAREAVARSYALCPKRTGALANTIRSELVVDESGVTINILAGGINGVDYAYYVMHGTSRMAAQDFLSPVEFDMERKLPVILPEKL